MLMLGIINKDGSNDKYVTCKLEFKCVNKCLREVFVRVIKVMYGLILMFKCSALVQVLKIESDYNV